MKKKGILLVISVLFFSAAIMPYQAAAARAPRIDSSLQALDWYLRQSEAELAQLQLLLKSASGEQRKKSQWQGKLLEEMLKRIDRIKQDMQGLPFLAGVRTEQAIAELRKFFQRYNSRIAQLAVQFDRVKTQKEFDKVTAEMMAQQKKLMKSMMALQKRFRNIDEKKLQQTLIKEGKRFQKTFRQLNEAKKNAEKRLQQSRKGKDKDQKKNSAKQ